MGRERASYHISSATAHEPRHTSGLGSIQLLDDAVTQILRGELDLAYYRTIE